MPAFYSEVEDIVLGGIAPERYDEIYAHMVKLFDDVQGIAKATDDGIYGEVKDAHGNGFTSSQW